MTDERVQQPLVPSRTTVVDAERQRLIRRTATVSFIGASVDSYDFFIYGTAAAIVFPKVFFPRPRRSSGCCSRSPRSASASSPAPSAV
jgi:hypothetical protein